MIRALIVGCVCWSSLAAAALIGTSLSPEQQEQYQRLAGEFVAPCCWRDPLASHRSPKADQAREELLALVRAGRSDVEIKEAFIDSHGEAILLVPQGTLARWLFVTPLVFTLAAFGVGAWLLVSLLRRKDRPKLSNTPLAEINEAELGW